jgi:hypothetical protein
MILAASKFRKDRLVVIFDRVWTFKYREGEKPSKHSEKSCNSTSLPPLSRNGVSTGQKRLETLEHASNIVRDVVPFDGDGYPYFPVKWVV